MSLDDWLLDLDSGATAPEGEDPFGVFDWVQTPVLVIDAEYRIRKASRLASELVDADVGESVTGRTCFDVLVSRTTPCDHCPIADGRSLGGVERSLKLVAPHRDTRYLKEKFAASGEFVFLTLSDVTREILALKKADLARKEALAKRGLLERLRREDAAEKAKINDLLDDLPDALMVVDRNYRVLSSNKAARGIFPGGDASTCYSIWGRDETCPSCPALDLTHLTTARKISHLVAGDYYTERITPLHDGSGAAILVRNTTREIQLIEKIREQQKTIAKSNEILKSLVRLGGAMQTGDDPEPVTHLFLDLFLSAAGVSSASIVVFDKRISNVWFSVTRGFDDSAMHELIKTCLSERRSTKLADRAQSGSLSRPGVVGFVIRGSDEQQVGCAFWAEPENPIDQQLVSLFFEPFGAFIHSHLLMRLLEEKANRDPLTGAYNRGYLSTALEEERSKYECYEIPYAIVVADINGLKQVNDQHGHEAGDRLIIDVAARFTAAIRNTDVLARTGGDEFVLLLTGSTEADAEAFVARIQEEVLAGASIDLSDGIAWPVAVSLGVCGVDGAAPADLTKIADRRMYEAKSRYYAARTRYR